MRSLYSSSTRDRVQYKLSLSLLLETLDSTWLRLGPGGGIAIFPHCLSLAHPHVLVRTCRSADYEYIGLSQ